MSGYNYVAPDSVYTLTFYGDLVYKGSRKTSVVRLPKHFIKSQVPGSEMKFIAVQNKFLVYLDM